MDKYMYKNEKQIEFIPASHHIQVVEYRHYCFSLAWLEWYEMITKLQVKSAKLCNNYTKQKNNNQYFWVFSFLNKAWKKQRNKGNLFGFLNWTEILKGQRKLQLENKKKNEREKDEIFLVFWGFVKVKQIQDITNKHKWNMDIKSTNILW